MPGWYRLRLAKGAWPVPCLVTYTKDGWQATIDGEAFEPHPDPWHATGVDRVHHYGQRISAAEYDRLLEAKEWARQHQPDHPCLHPRRAIDRLTIKPLSTKDFLL
jgi:hypothetical protein